VFALTNLVLFRLPLTLLSISQIMNDPLSRAQYLVTLQTIAHCPGCLDMNPSIFDWRAVRWAPTYPKLDPQKIIHGSRNQCTSCTMIKDAFHSVGLDLNMAHDRQNLQLSLFHMDQDGSLLASAASREKYSIVELYTVPGKLLSALLISDGIYNKCKVLRSCNCTTDWIFSLRQSIFTMEHSSS
jgi:hypothetical protein